MISFFIIPYFFSNSKHPDRLSLLTQHAGFGILKKPFAEMTEVCIGKGTIGFLNSHGAAVLSNSSINWNLSLSIYQHRSAR